MPNSLYDDDETQDHAGPEISIGTTSIVGIFFVLVLICAVFFGIGYTLGHRQGVAQGQSQPQAAAPAATTAAASTRKPAPGDPEANTPAPSSNTPSDAPAPTPSAPSDNAPAPAPARPTPASTAPTPAAEVMVQIAALTHEEDAKNEVAELQKRGYKVFARHDPNDRFIRIQIGPFATRKEAKDMCDRLLASGYNAIIK